MANMRGIEPIVGDWYRSHGQLFEVVAIDENEGVIDLQHADGDLEEIELDDWATRSRAGSLVAAESPEDLRASTDTVSEDGGEQASQNFEDLHDVRANGIEDLDLFD
jgi:hypothetical protein